MVEPTSLLLGLEGLGVRGVVQRADRTRVVEVVTVDPNAARCPDCGIASDSVKERTVTSPRDIRYGDDPIVLRWNKTDTAAATTPARGPASPRPSSRYRRGGAPPVGCAPRSPARLGMRPARWSRSPMGPGCPGRRRMPRSLPTPRRSWAPRPRCGCWASTRPAAASLLDP